LLEQRREKGRGRQSAKVRSIDTDLDPESDPLAKEMIREIDLQKDPPKGEIIIRGMNTKETIQGVGLEEKIHEKDQGEMIREKGLVIDQDLASVQDIGQLKPKVKFDLEAKG
jgi:hypothetical protein